MVETHPFGNFVPHNARFLFLGSFTGKQVEGYDWFFSNKRNQLWPMLSVVFNIKLTTKEEKQELFTKLKMAITDIILTCERKSNSNLDMNLTNITYNTNAIVNIIQQNNIENIYFSSRFAEKLFKNHFKDTARQHPTISLITLPSPSPRYASMSKYQKIEKYKELLPKLI